MASASARVSTPDDDTLPGSDTLYDDAPCGLLLTGTDGRIRRANRTFCEWTGHPCDVLAGRRFQDLLTAGGRIFHHTHWAPLLAMQGSVAEVKLDILHRDGHTVPMMLNAKRQRHGEAVFDELALFVAKDRHAYERELLHARKRSDALLTEQLRVRDELALTDARLRMALDTAELYYWEADPATGGRRYDPRVALLLGYPQPRPVEFEEFRAAIDPADRDRAFKAFAEMVGAGEGVYRCSYRVNGVDGVQRTVLATARAHAEPGGRVRQVIGLLQDISAMARQQKLAEVRASFAEQMVGIVSHDLRNPLSAINYAAHALRHAGLPPEFERAIDHIDQSTRRAQRLIGDLLDFTRARIGGGLPLKPEPLDLHALVHACVDELARAHPGHVLHHEAIGTGSCTADPDRLYQLIGNLVSNAVAYGDAERPVTVRSHIDGDACRIAVHNFGRAIPADMIPTLFEPMVRGETRHGDIRSVGLGLYIVREIARAHGGEVSVHSDDRDGTGFVVVLPVRA